MTIQDLIKTYPNDAELGAAVRSLFMGDCEIAFLLEDKKSYLSIEDEFEETQLKVSVKANIDAKEKPGSDLIPRSQIKVILEDGESKDVRVFYRGSINDSNKDELIKSANDYAQKLRNERLREKDYEILSIRHECFIYTRDNLPGYDKIIEGSMRFLVHNNWTIYSIKRLSDGEVFTIGDIVRFPTIEGYITAIVDHYIAIQDFKTRIANVAHVYTKAKKLFTTEDGIDIYENENNWNKINNIVHHDKIYYIVLSNMENIQETYEFSHIKDKLTSIKTFSTKGKAEKYVRMNAIKYSLKDVQNAYKKLIGNGQVPSYRTPNIDEISLSLEKINKDKDCVEVANFKNKQEDYEILSFHHNGSFYAKDSFTDSENVVFDGILRNNMESIIVDSMKRLSDGAVFNVGNIVKFPHLRPLPITEILPTGYICHKEISEYILNVKHA